MRPAAAVSPRISSATVGMLTSAEKINSEIAIDSTVRIVRRLPRTRFFNTSAVYFMPTQPSCRRRRFRRHAAFAGLDAGEHALVEPIDGIDVALGAGVMRDHHDRFLELAIHIDQQA